MEFELEWKNEYSIGIEEIDIQHRKMLAMIKKIYNLADNSFGKSDIEQLISELIKIIHEHFTCEEELMRKYNYPEVNKQIYEHHLISEKMQQQINEVKKDQYHDNKYDKEFGKFVLRKLEI